MVRRVTCPNRLVHDRHERAAIDREVDVGDGVHFGRALTVDLETARISRKLIGILQSVVELATSQALRTTDRRRSASGDHSLRRLSEPSRKPSG